MKQYLKMADVFNGPVGFDCDGDFFDNDVFFGTIDMDKCDAVEHAINSHDELVQMSKELLAALEALDDIYCDTSRDHITRTDLKHHKSVLADVQIIIAKAKGGAA